MTRYTLLLCLCLAGCLQPVASAPTVTAAALGQALAVKIEAGEVETTQEAWKAFQGAAKKVGLDATLGPVPKNERMTPQLRTEWAAKARGVK